MVETGPTATLFARPEHPYTRMLLAAEPEGTKPPPPAGAPELMTGDDVQGDLPTGGGLFSAAHELRAVDGVSLHLREGQTIGIVGEFGLGQVDPRPRAAAAAAERRAHRLSRPAARPRPGG